MASKETKKKTKTWNAWIECKENPIEDFIKFSNLPHYSRMNYEGDGGILGPNANQVFRNLEHVDYVIQQLEEYRNTPSIDPRIPKSDKKSLRYHLYHAIADARLAEYMKKGNK